MPSAHQDAAPPLSPLGAESDVAPAAATICAALVTYRPDPALRLRLEAIRAQLAALVIVDNGSAEGVDVVVGALSGMPGVSLIRNPTNLGLARGLNQALAEASRLGYRWVLTLDQDSAPYPHLVATLADIYGRCDPRPAVIGSNHRNAFRRREFIAPARGEPSDWTERKTVITAGMLIDGEFARRLGGFREDYFVDSVDHEFCLRVRSAGGRVVMSRAPLLLQRIGEQSGRPAWLQRWLAPVHPPERKYYVARNALVTVGRYWRSEPAWCAKQVVRLGVELGSILLAERHKGLKLRAFLEGIGDGLRNRLGPRPPAGR